MRTSEALNLWLERLRNPAEGQLFKGVNRAQKITGSSGSGQINRKKKRLTKQAGMDKELIEQISGSRYSQFKREYTHDYEQRKVVKDRYCDAVCGAY